MMYTMTVKLYGVIAVIAEDEIICDDEIIKQLLIPFLENRLYRWASYGIYFKIR